ncbi:hypothetical protein AB0F20_26325 [Streptomyces goshikiensis]|uniref:hypothetical protein n=1 Tax=Streptomyces goshikiensis TaxID=1942 RepID=UPI0033C92B29
MTKDYFEVDVPIRNTEGLRGVHVFTGHADSDSAASKAAHEVYDAPAPLRRPDAKFTTAARTDGALAGTGPAGNSTGPPRRPAAG